VAFEPTILILCLLDEPHKISNFTQTDRDDLESTLTADNAIEVFDLPPDRKFDNGTVQNVKEWLFDQVPLPANPSGSRMSVQATFDRVHAAVGMDNIVLTTQQK